MKVFYTNSGDSEVAKMSIAVCVSAVLFSFFLPFPVVNAKSPSGALHTRDRCVTAEAGSPFP